MAKLPLLPIYRVPNASLDLCHFCAKNLTLQPIIAATSITMDTAHDSSLSSLKIPHRCRLSVKSRSQVLATGKAWKWVLFSSHGVVGVRYFSLYSQNSKLKHRKPFGSWAKWEQEIITHCITCSSFLVYSIFVEHNLQQSPCIGIRKCVCTQRAFFFWKILILKNALIPLFCLNDNYIILARELTSLEMWKSCSIVL